MLSKRRGVLFIALTLTFICIFSKISAATEINVLYFQNEAGQMIKVDYESASAIGGPMLTTVRNLYNSALLYGRSVFLEKIDGKVFDWSENINGLGQPWSVVQAGPSTSAPAVQKIIKTDGSIADVASSVSFTKTIVQDPMGGTIVTVAVGDTDAKRVIGITIKGVAAVRLVGSTNKWRAILEPNILVNDSDIVLNTGAATEVEKVNDLIDTTIPDSDADKATAFQYTSQITSNDLKVHSFKRYTVGDNEEFFVDFESGTVRNVSFFNPPSGSVFMKRSYQMAAGRYLLKVKIPTTDLARVKEVTLKFWTEGKDSHEDYIFTQLNTTNGSGTPVENSTNNLIDTSIPDSDADKATTLQYTSGITSSNLKVYSFKRYNAGDNAEFFVDFETGIERNVSFFNPPNGSVFMKYAYQMAAGRYLLKVKIPTTDLAMMKEITVKFWTDGNGNGGEYIFTRLNGTNGSGTSGGNSTNNLIDTSIPDGEADKATALQYTSGITSSDLKVYSFKRYNNGDNAEFFVDFETGIERNVSFFNPPDGSVFMKYAYQMAAGRYLLKVKIPTTDLAMMKEITVKFWTNGNGNGGEYIFTRLNGTNGSGTSGGNSTNNLIDTSIPDGDADKATALQYTSGITSSNLKVYSFKRYNNGDNAEFFVDFETGIERNVSFFNPPSGSVFMKYAYQMAAGRYLLKVKIPTSDLAMLKEITVKFWTDGNGNDGEYIFTRLNSTNGSDTSGENLADRLIDTTIPDDDVNKANDLPYNSRITSSDLKVFSFKRYDAGDNVEFFVDFQSDSERGVSFFNPPNGSVFMKYNPKMAAGRYLLKIKVPTADLALVKDVTVKFWTNGNENSGDFIFTQLNDTNASGTGGRNIPNSLIDTTIPDEDADKAADIKYSSRITSKDLKVNSFKKYTEGDNVEFFLDFETGSERGVSFFNPPNGSVFMKSNYQMKAGQYLLKIKIPSKDLVQANGITIKFWTSDDPIGDFIFTQLNNTDNSTQ